MAGWDGVSFYDEFLIFIFAPNLTILNAAKRTLRAILSFTINIWSLENANSWHILYIKLSNIFRRLEHTCIQRFSIPNFNCKSISVNETLRPILDTDIFKYIMFDMWLTARLTISQFDLYIQI